MIQEPKFASKLSISIIMKDSAKKSLNLHLNYSHRLLWDNANIPKFALRLPENNIK